MKDSMFGQFVESTIESIDGGKMTIEEAADLITREHEAIVGFHRREIATLEESKSRVQGTLDKYETAFAAIRNIFYLTEA